MVMQGLTIKIRGFIIHTLTMKACDVSLATYIFPLKGPTTRWVNFPNSRDFSSPIIKISQ